MTKFILFVSFSFILASCASYNDDWDSGASKKQADQMEEQVELQNTIRNQAPPVTP